MGLQTVTKGALPQSSDVNQFALLFQGRVDIGALTLPGQTSSPSTAPTVTLSSGSLTGTSYQWGFYWITGTVNDSGTVNVTGRTTPSPLSTAQSLSSQQATVSISGITIPTAVIGWGVARNKSGGSTWYEVPGSEQFGNSDGTNIPLTYVDDTADANLVTAEPSSNTTGTYLENYLRTDSGAPNPQTVANGMNIGGGVNVNGNQVNSIGSTELALNFSNKTEPVHSYADFVSDGAITSSTGELGSASGTWTPGSGSMNVAPGAVFNVATVPSGAKFFDTVDTTGVLSGSPSIGQLQMSGIMQSSGAAGQSSNSISTTPQVWSASAVSSTTTTGSLTTVTDGSYRATGYYQLNGGYLQFVVTASTSSTGDTASTVKWGVA